MLRVEHLHFSALKWMGMSPAHFKHAYENPTEPTPAMAFGTLVHELVLGGDGFVIWEGDRRAGKEWDAFKAANAGKLIVKADEFARAEAAALAVLENPDAAVLIASHQKERLWESEMHGRKCRGRIDLSGASTAELKVSMSVDPRRFIPHATRMGWHAQVAWYQDARRALGEDPGEGKIVSVEAKAPHVVTVFRLTQGALNEGRKLIRAWTEQLAACEASQHWPGFVQSVVDFDIAEDAGVIFDDVEAA